METREPLPRFLIVCEGEQTEPNYFKSFRVPKEVLDVRGLGDNTLRLVEKAVEFSNAANPHYDQVWCVFDRDSFPAEHFNAALDLAERQAIKVAYSNEAFELWYLLHFHFYNTGISRSQYKEKLSEQLGHRYEKNSRTIYAEIEEKQSDAIANAKRLLSFYAPPDPCNNNPSTTVFRLVEELNRFAR